MGLEIAVSVGMNSEVVNFARGYKKNLEFLLSKNKNLEVFEFKNKKEESKEKDKVNDLIEKIKIIDINEISPKKAHDFLYEIKKELFLND